MAKADYKKELDELAASARRARGVESAIVKSYEDGEDAEIHVDIDSESTVHMHRYGDGTWWWQRGYGYEMEDEDITGKPFKEALKDALVVDNPRKKKSKKKSPLKKRVKKAEKKVVRGAKKAGRKVKKFAKTKTGYTAGAAGIGALALGPLGAIAGAIGGSALYDNPGHSDLFAGYETKVETYSDGELKKQFEEHSETLSASKHPVRDFGTEGYPMYVRILAILRAEMSRRGLLVMNPRKKKAGRKVKKAGRKVKKFAKTKTGYGALGAGAGALLLGPIGAIAGAVGASKLHDNPELRKNAAHPDSFPKHKHAWGFEGSEGTAPGRKEGQLFKCRECGMRGRSTDGGHTVRRITPKARTGGPPKRNPRRKNPSAVDHERVGMDALKQSEKYHRRYMEHNRLNDLLDTYKWLLIAHEELKYSGKAEPRIQARDGLKAVRRLLLERM